ncbi:ATPase [Gracilibacillus halophilus YIM-C55.5]|uniref:ATPase n=1 Tax=Gracilibacillus halophilus YIM-C55.5 TaxID=1308866 RepID=N4WKG1_9BACI|nr:ATP-binding cassette domain-containing protein [Gracilibacillus halophilus]ENH96637.1 ATPase [Gracilibacillus halophilus YIM-C55.5]
MLTISNLTYHIANKGYLFQNVTLSVQPGEIVGLTGHSGIGKSTFAKVVAGYLTPDEGTINRVQNKRQPHPVQLIWQHPEQAVNPKWRIKKVLEEAGPIDDEWLERLQIHSSWLKRFPDQLSGGELQRICIARCLMTRPDFIIADEITTMLDPITQADIWDVLRQIAKTESIGILAISHHYELLERLTDRTLSFETLSKK